MIIATGYSKDPNIVPEGIVITFGSEMMKEQGGAKKFLSFFIECMNECDEDIDRYWMHKCSNLPTIEVDVIYIIVMNRLWAKVYCGGYKRNLKDVVGYQANGKAMIVYWNHIILSGPIIKCPFKRELKGFQGFRYCTKLF